MTHAANGRSDLDRIDLKILNCLQEDGRMSNLKLAETVTLSPTAVLSRVQRLTKDGYILGYEARLNPLKLGAGEKALVMGEPPCVIVVASNVPMTCRLKTGALVPMPTLAPSVTNRAGTPSLVVPTSRRPVGKVAPMPTLPLLFKVKAAPVA